MKQQTISQTALDTYAKAAYDAYYNAKAAKAAAHAKAKAAAQVGQSRHPGRLG